VGALEDAAAEVDADVEERGTGRGRLDDAEKDAGSAWPPDEAVPVRVKPGEGAVDFVNEGLFTAGETRRGVTTRCPPFPTDDLRGFFPLADAESDEEPAPPADVRTELFFLIASGSVAATGVEVEAVGVPSI